MNSPPAGQVNRPTTYYYQLKDSHRSDMEIGIVEIRFNRQGGKIRGRDEYSECLNRQDFEMAPIFWVRFAKMDDDRPGPSPTL